MLIIADSGSTKTEWAFVQDGQEVKRLVTDGLNPYVRSEVEIHDTIAALAASAGYSQVNRICYYGAGCGSAGNQALVHQALCASFGHCQIDVSDDLLGAARGLCLRKPGVACILGTGSNACVYDGEKITERIASLGYVLGDEGSGASIGKKLVKAFLSHSMPKDLERAFLDHFAIQKNDVLDAVYRGSWPNKYLASFVPFCDQFKGHPFVLDLLTNAFNEFVALQLESLVSRQQLPVSFTGSVAWYFRQELTSVCLAHGIQTDTILKTPISGMIKYSILAGDNE